MYKKYCSICTRIITLFSAHWLEHLIKLYVIQWFILTRVLSKIRTIFAQDVWFHFCASQRTHKDYFQNESLVILVCVQEKFWSDLKKTKLIKRGLWKMKMLPSSQHAQFMYFKTSWQFNFQIRRQARLRREYLYRKAIEDRDKTILEKKQKLKQVLDGK